MKKEKYSASHSLVRYWVMPPLLAVLMVVLTGPILTAATGTNRVEKTKLTDRQRNKMLAQAWNRWNKLTHDYYLAVPDWSRVIINGKLRAKFAPHAIPILRKLVETEDQISQLEPSYGRYLMYYELRNIAQLASFGDKAAIARLAATAKNKDPRTSMIGQLEKAQYKWWTANGDPAKQLHILRSLAPLTKTFPSSNALTLGLVNMGAFADTVNPRVSEYAVKLAKSLRTPIAQSTAESLQSRLKLTELVGKPFTLQTPTLTGDTFNLKKWRGKVVLITFWNQPVSQFRLGSIYQQFHPQGLEILGVPVNQRFTRIGTIMMTHPDISWTQTAIQKPTGPNRTIFGLPIGPHDSMLILVGRKGIVRMISNDSRMTNVVAEIRKLLAK